MRKVNTALIPGNEGRVNMELFDGYDNGIRDYGLRRA